MLKYFADPFLVFKVNHPQSGKPVVIFKSEVIQNNLKPTWKPFEIFLEDVYGPTTSITIEVYDYDDDGTFDFIGGTSSTVNELIQGKYERPLINPEKQGRMLYKNSGIVYVDKFEPIDASQRRPAATGFRLKLHATKLDSKDAK
jgi:Ca2+-dependent lipid-binding protein